MSKENTRKFFDEVDKNESLKATLLESPAQAWVSQAKTAGLDFSVDELADELIAYIRVTQQGELNDGSLDAVTGGAGIAQRKVVAQQVAPGVVSAQHAAALKLQPLGGARLPGKGAARW